MGDINSFMIWFNLLVGAYVTFVAITGKGKPYENDYPKEIKEEVYKMNRLMYAIAGPALIISGVLELVGVTQAQWISIGVVLLLITAYLIVFYRKFGKAIKEARKKKF